VRELDRAEALARQLVAMEPDNGAAFGRLAWVLTERGRYAEAIEAARQAIELDPNNYAAWANLGFAAIELDRRDEAIAASREALRLRPGLVSATTNLVAALRAAGQLDEALVVVTHARLRDPQSAAIARLHAEVTGEVSRRDTLRWSDRAVLTVLLLLVTLAVAWLWPWLGVGVGVLCLVLAVLLWRGVVPMRLPRVLAGKGEDAPRDDGSDRRG
jgi:tetratricopeptide (TPR) repeat protein